MEAITNKLYLRTTPKTWQIGPQNGLKLNWGVSWCMEISEGGDPVVKMAGAAYMPSGRRAGVEFPIFPEQLNEFCNDETLPEFWVELFKQNETELLKYT